MQITLSLVSFRGNERERERNECVSHGGVQNETSLIGKKKYSHLFYLPCTPKNQARYIHQQQTIINNK